MNVFVKKYEKAIEYYLMFQKNHTTFDGKIEYLSGIAFENTNQTNKACNNFRISLNKGYKASRDKLKSCN